MACAECIVARLEGVGYNLSVDGGEVRVLGCKKHLNIFLERYHKGLKAEEKATAKEGQAKNEKFNRGETTPPENRPEAGGGEEPGTSQEEGVQND